MKLDRSKMFDLEYDSLLSGQRNELKEQILVLILGTLILGGWSVLGVISVETSRKFLGLLDSCTATTVIFLVIIPCSIFLVLVRWESTARNILVIKYEIVLFEIEFAKNFPDNFPLLIKSNAALKTVKSASSFLKLNFRKQALSAALFSFILVDLSGTIGFQKIEQTDILVFSLSYIVFYIQASRILLYAANLVTAIQEAR